MERHDGPKERGRLDGGPKGWRRRRRRRGNRERRRRRRNWGRRRSYVGGSPTPGERKEVRIQLILHLEELETGEGLKDALRPQPPDGEFPQLRG